ncbi:MAG: hypothetical protein U5L06_07915 [Rhodovibrio sp.]|nr:hypothetical protein [Rhodovibrio sp.]
MVENAAVEEKIVAFLGFHPQLTASGVNHYWNVACENVGMSPRQGVRRDEMPRGRARVSAGYRVAGAVKGDARRHLGAGARNRATNGCAIAAGSWAVLR